VAITLLSGAEEGEVVRKEVGEEERGARGGVDRATMPYRAMLRLIRIAAVLAAARPTLLFRPLFY